MSNNQHKDPINQDFEKSTFDHFDRVKIPFAKSKDDVWEEINKKIDLQEPTKKSKTINLKFAYGIAATLLILISVSSLLLFQKVSIDNPSGSHLSKILPDGSIIELNAQSSVEYYPYRWYFSRTLYFEGEAFFDVKKGKKFTVVSDLAQTSVLGTSFNIYARNKEYDVTCITGKVKVTSNNQNEGILTAGYQASLNQNGEVIVYKSQDSKSSISWKDHKFIFTAVPFWRVIQEIERQYAVNIEIPEDIQLSYTGYFTRDKSIEEVLNLVCRPFGLNFVEESGTKFIILKN
jgi:ferric-dicitrate binding protein FerR (iron transport regulator)